MTDYSKLTDEGLNRAVGNIVGITFDTLENAECYHPLCYWKNGELCVFEPCNNAADAWPIIVKNGISLECITVNRHEKTWRALFKPAYVKHHVNDKNPLRAAMIVFLMMQENTRGN